MTTSRMPKRVISTMLAAVLAITLIPSEALPEAYATPASDAAASDGASTAADGTAQKAQDAPDAAGDTPDAQDASDADADIERPASVVSATERIADDAPAKPSVEMTRASVNLSAGEDAPYAVFSQGPLSFQVNADDPATAAVVGVDAHTDATDLVIPAEVVLSGEAYPVTRMIGGGGVSVLATGGEDPHNAEKNPTADAVSDDPASGEDAAASDAAGSPASIAAAAPYAIDSYAASEKAPSVRTITIPATVEHIDLAFFQLFPNAASIAVAEGSQTYSSENGMLLDAAKTNLLLVPEGMEGKAVLPDTVATVPACVLSRCTKLSAMTADEAAGSTGHSALATVDGIIYTKDKTTLLAAPAGAGASVAIAPECETIAAGAFWGNAHLKTIVATGAVGSIASGVTDAEGLCDALGIRAGAASSGSERADAEDSAAGDSPDVPIAAFDGTTIANATIVTSERAAWEAAGFAHFAEPAKPGDAAEQDGFAFTLLSDFTLAVSWADEAPAPEELAVPVTGMVGGAEYAVSTIERDAFKGQEGIRALTIPEGISSVGDAAFFGCAGLESAQLAGSVTSIGASAFQGCTELAAADLGGGVRTIGASAFEQTALPSAVLPASVRSIGERAFASDAALVRIVALSDIPEVDATALADCTGVEIYAPYREDGAYAWAPGVPATGNHLMPYGVELASEPLVLGQGQSADLLEGGRLEAPGSVEVLCSYNASPISVDVASAQVSAKQTGKTTVTATLKLADAALASASRPVVVEAAPSEEPKKEEEAHEHEPGEETGDEVSVDHPEVSYTDQLFEEGDYYTSGAHVYEEKVINRSVALADMDAGISTMSMVVPDVASWENSGSSSGNFVGTTGTRGWDFKYDADTKTLTVDMKSVSTWCKVSECGGAINCQGSSGAHNYMFRKSREKLNAVRKLVLKNFDHKYPKMFFSKMMNLEKVEIYGNFLENIYDGKTSGVTNISSMFEDCPQLRVIDRDLRFPSTVTTSTSLFGFSTHKIDGTNTSWQRLTSANQLVNDRLLTAYTGSDATVIKQLKYATNTSSDSHYRDLVTTYHNVYFDNQGGTGGHERVWEQWSSFDDTYGIRVPHGSPIPELVGHPSYSDWDFGGYVDEIGTVSPKQYINRSCFPHYSSESSEGAQIRVLSNMTLKAFWFRSAEIHANGGYFSKFPMSSRAVRLAKGYSIEQQQRMDKKYAGDLPDFGSPFIRSVAADAEDNKQALVCTNDGRRLRGFTVANNTGNYTYSTAYYDADFKGTSAVYNQPDDLYAMWGYYTVSVYSNVQLSYTVQKTHWSNSEMTNVAHYGTVGTGTIGASNSNPLRVDDVYSYTVNAENLWRQSKWGNVRVGNGPYGLNPQYGAVPTGTDDASYERNYRTLTLKAPTGYEFVEARLGSPSGSVIERKQYTNSHTNISGNISIYLIYKDTRSTVNIYTSVRTAWTPGSKMMYDASGSYTSSVAGPAKGESGDEFKSPFVIRDVQAVDFWPSSTINTHNRSYSEPDKSGFSVNNRLSLPAYHEIESVQYRYGDTGDKTDVTYSTQNKFEYKYKMDGRPFNIYITYKDNTPNDTITWKADGGYLNGDTKVTETSNTAKRGTKVTAPAIARANSTDTRYTFLGWYSGDTKVCGAGGQVTANGAATYTAKWKTEYKITWNTGMAGSHWGSVETDTAAKEIWVESGKAVAAPTAPTKKATSDTRWTWEKWNTAPATPATGPATYTGVWKTEYKTVWKLGSTEAYWGTDKSDKNDKEKWFKSGDAPTQPAVANRDAVAQYTYSFSSWNGITSTVTAPAIYTAIWDSVVNKYDTTWDVNGGFWNDDKADTAQKKTTQQAYGTLLSGPAGYTPHKTRHTFVGWSTDKNADPDDAAKHAKQISVTGASTYYAIYAPDGYTIKLMKNDGTDDVAHGPQLGAVSARYDRNWTIGAGHVPNRRGYYFIGWDTDPAYAGDSPAYPMRPNSNGVYEDATFSGNLIGETGSAEAMLYAVWTESTYTIVFHENWGDGDGTSGEPPAKLEPLYSAKVTIPGQNTMKRTGWYFTGWNTRADGSGVDYKTGNVRQFVGHNDFSDAEVRGATVNLHAQWEPNNYFVFFEPNTSDEWSDEGCDTMLALKWGDTVTIATEFSRPGYEFVGWSFDRTVESDESGTPKVDFHVGDTFTNLTDVRNGVVRLYAQWKGAPYQIVFDGNADDEHLVAPGEDGPMQPLEMFLGVGRKLPKNTFTCPGFAFKGWNTKPDGTGEAYADTELVQDVPGIKDGRVVLYAQWSPVISMTSPINAHIEVYIDGMDVRVTAVRPGSPQEVIESQTRGKLFIEAMELEPNLDAEAGMARIFPVDGAPTRDSWEDFTLEFTALNEESGKQVKSSIDFGNAFAFLPGQRNNYFVPAYDTANSAPGRLPYKLSMAVPEDAPVRYSEQPVQVGTLVFTCSLAE